MSPSPSIQKIDPPIINIKVLSTLSSNTTQLMMFSQYFNVLRFSEKNSSLLNSSNIWVLKAFMSIFLALSSRLWSSSLTTHYKINKIPVYTNIWLGGLLSFIKGNSKSMNSLVLRTTLYKNIIKSSIHLSSPWRRNSGESVTQSSLKFWCSTT